MKRFLFYFYPQFERKVIMRQRTITRDDVKEYVSYRVDDAMHATQLTRPTALAERDWLIVWQCGFEPMAVAVGSYLPNTMLDCDEAITIAKDWLAERKWFSGEPVDPDYVVQPEIIDSMIEEALGVVEEAADILDRNDALDADNLRYSLGSAMEALGDAANAKVLKSPRKQEESL